MTDWLDSLPAAAVDLQQATACLRGEQNGSPWRVFQRRARYVARWCYWAIRHRSTKHAAWVCAFEGYMW